MHALPQISSPSIDCKYQDRITAEARTQVVQCIVFFKESHQEEPFKVASLGLKPSRQMLMVTS